MFLKGDRCYSDKCSFETTSIRTGPAWTGTVQKTVGLRSSAQRKTESKEHVRHARGPISSNVSDRLIVRKGVTGENLLDSSWKADLDNAVFRMGFASSRNQARQLVRHKHILGQWKESQYSFFFESRKVMRLSIKEKSRANA